MLVACIITGGLMIALCLWLGKLHKEFDRSGLGGTVIPENFIANEDTKEPPW